MRSNIVAGNWKMNNDLAASNALVHEIMNQVAELTLENTRVIVAPTFVNLSSVVEAAKESAVEVAAQNMHQAASGAFTGEISGEMLKGIGIESVILGHSERRAYFGEDDALLAEKVNGALKNNLEVIFCFGEELEDRKSDNHFNVVESQLKNGVFHLEAAAWKNIVLAYEPVWAIGTGETASPEQAQEMHAFIRNLIVDTYGAEVANEVSILYGGSVKPANAEEIFSNPDVDGGLIGGAALNADDFVSLVKSF
jgi:triosephosphate isomerase